MRLPTWFAIGNAFGETAGFDVEAFQGSELWASNGETSEFELRSDEEVISTDGDELAIVVSIATNIESDAREHIARIPGVGTVVYLQPQGGPSRDVVPHHESARGLAVAIRNTARELVQTHKPARIHLFLAMPSAAAMLLGHLWDRIGETQLYTDLAPGYTPAYLIPN